jgi:hypothetical protein
MFQLQQFVRSAHQQFRSLCFVIIRELHIKRRAQLIAVLAFSLGIGGLCTQFVLTAHNAKSQWSDYQSVLITRSQIRAGEALSTLNTTLVRIPVVFVPATSLTALLPSTTARVALSANTMVSASLIQSDNTTIDIPEGWRGIAVPRDLRTPPLSAGDVVDVVSTALTISAGAIVIGMSSTTGITIAVPAESAPAVATPFRLGEASLVLAK